MEFKNPTDTIITVTEIGKTGPVHHSIQAGKTKDLPDRIKDVALAKGLMTVSAAKKEEPKEKK